MFDEKRLAGLIDSLGFDEMDVKLLKKYVAEFCYLNNADRKDHHFFPDAITVEEHLQLLGMGHMEALQREIAYKDEFGRLLFDAIQLHADCQDRETHRHVYNALEQGDKALLNIFERLGLDAYLLVTKEYPLYNRLVADFTLTLCLVMHHSCRQTEHVDRAKHWLKEQLDDCFCEVLRNARPADDLEGPLRYRFGHDAAAGEDCGFDQFAGSTRDVREYQGTETSFEARVLLLQHRGVTKPVALPRLREQLDATDEGFQAYYDQWRPYILEEVRADIEARLKFLAKRKIPFFRITLGNRMPGDGGVVLQIEAEAKQLPELDHNFSFEVVRLTPERGVGDAAFSCWGIVTIKRHPREEDNPKKYSLRIDLLRGDADRLYQGCRKGDEMHADWLSGLISAQRMDMACLIKPQPPFIEMLVTARLPALPEPDHVSRYEALPVAGSLNPCQLDAVSRFYQTDSGCFMIMGPPGTGKTTMSVTLMRLLVTNKDCRILYAAPSNKAVQESAVRMMRELPAEIHIAYTGVAKDLPPELEPVLINDQVTKICKGITVCWKPIRGFHDHLMAKFGKGIAPEQLKLREALKNCLALVEYFQQAIALLERLQEPTPLKLNQRKQQQLEALFESILPELRLLVEWVEMYKALVIEVNTQLKDGRHKKHQHTQEEGELKQSMVDLKDLVRKCVEQLSDSHELIEIALLQRAQIVFCTLVTSGRWWLQKNIGQDFDVLIVDEAAQALEPEILIPFVHYPKRLLMIGDPKQLPPTVTSKHNKRNAFDESMMARLHRLKNPFHMLTIQYRMHPAICQFPSSQYYGGKLVAAEGLAEQRLPLLEGKVDHPALLSPCSFFNVNGEENRRGSDLNPSISNDQEADAAIILLMLLLKHLKPHQIGVVSYYAAQVALLCRKAGQIADRDLRQKAAGVTIKTVDGFQGGEKDVIIASPVRTRKDCGFLRDERRLNVSLTRSRYHLFVVGRIDALATSNTDFAPMLRHFQETPEAEVVEFGDVFRLEPK